MMKFDKVSKKFGYSPLFADFSFQFERGRYCIVGENGCGKTTLLMMAAGSEPVDAGVVTFDQIEVTDVRVKSQIGISSDKIILPRFLRARQLIEFHCQVHQAQWPEGLIEQLHFKAHLGTAAEQLSLGNQKKLSLILALSHQPQCLLLDEPTTGLDTYSRGVVVELLDAFEGLMLVTSHEPHFSQNSDFELFELAKYR